MISVKLNVVDDEGAKRFSKKTNGYLMVVEGDDGEIEASIGGEISVVIKLIGGMRAVLESLVSERLNANITIGNFASLAATAPIFDLSPTLFVTILNTYQEALKTTPDLKLVDFISDYSKRETHHA